jgi:hypothetical protein
MLVIRCHEFRRSLYIVAIQGGERFKRLGTVEPTCQWTPTSAVKKGRSIFLLNREGERQTCVLELNLDTCDLVEL